MNWRFDILSNPTYEECDLLLNMAQNSFKQRAESIYFFKMVSDYGKIFLCFDINEPICMVQTMKSWNAFSNVQIISMATHPDYQGKGVGTWIIGEMIKKLKAERVKSVGIRIPPDNLGMLKIFRDKYEFKVQRMLPNYYGFNENRLYLEKTI